MSREPFNPISKGDVFDPYAAEWNTMLQQLKGNDFVKDDVFGSFNVCFAKNQTGADLERFHVAGIGGFAVTPTANINTFGRRVLFQAVATVFDDHCGRFLVAAQPIKNNAVGRFYLDTIIPANVNITNSWHGFCDVEDGQTKLKSMPHGTAQIVLPESSTGTDVKCYIRPGVPREVTLYGRPSVAWTSATTNGSMQVYRNEIASGYSISGVTAKPFLKSGEPSVLTSHDIAIKWTPYEKKWRLVHAVCP